MRQICFYEDLGEGVVSFGGCLGGGDDGRFGGYSPKDRGVPEPEGKDPQNPNNQGPNAGQIQQDFYNGDYGKLFNECLGEVFGKDAPASQTLGNAPRLITSESSQTLKTKSGAETRGTVIGIIVPPKKGNGGAIEISEGQAYFYGTNAANDAIILMTYGHELANLLDYRINPKGKNGKRPGQVYGSPSIIDPITGYPTDPDSGQAMENCMKRKQG